MIYTINAKHLSVTESMEDIIKKKTSYLKKYLDEGDMVTIKIKKEPDCIKLTLIAPTKFRKITLVATAYDANFYKAIDVVSDKLKYSFMSVYGKRIHSRKCSKRIKNEIQILQTV